MKSNRWSEKSYFSLFELLFSEEDWIGTLDFVKRSICISKQTKQSQVFGDVCSNLYNKITVLNGRDKGFLSLRLIDVILAYEYGNYDSILSIIDSIIENNSQDITKTEQAYEQRAICLNKLKRNADVRLSYLQLAEYYAKKADSIYRADVQGALRSQHLYHKAIMLFRNNGNTQKAEETHRKLVSVQKDIPQNMAVIPFEFDVSKLVKNIELNFSELTRMKSF